MRKRALEELNANLVGEVIKGHEALCRLRDRFCPGYTWDAESIAEFADALHNAMESSVVSRGAYISLVETGKAQDAKIVKLMSEAARAESLAKKVADLEAINNAVYGDFKVEKAHREELERLLGMADADRTRLRKALNASAAQMNMVRFALEQAAEDAEESAEK